jgi:hypothetical protein
VQICDESGGGEGRVTSDEQYAYTKNVPDIQINPKDSLSTVATSAENGHVSNKEWCKCKAESKATLL